MSPRHEERPATISGRASLGRAETSTTESTLTATDVLARASRHDYALRVVWERADGRFCTHLYTTLPAAERKLRSTRERGRHAQVHLVRLVDVQALDAEGVAL